MYEPDDTVVFCVTDEYDKPNVMRRSDALSGLTPVDGRTCCGWSRFLAILLRALAAWPV